MINNIQALSYTDAVHVVHQAENNKRSATAVVNQIRYAAAVDHSCAIEHTSRDRDLVDGRGFEPATLLLLSVNIGLYEFDGLANGVCERL